MTLEVLTCWLSIPFVVFGVYVLLSSVLLFLLPLRELYWHELRAGPILAFAWVISAHIMAPRQK